MIAIAALAAIALGACSGSKFATVGTDQFETVAATAGMQVVDVRTPAEFMAGHLPGAVNIDVQAEGFASIARVTLDRKRQVAVYCRSGRRSAAAAQILAKQGYKVTNLDGGITAWQVAGKPVEK